jgi:hypothetical protein
MPVRNNITGIWRHLMLPNLTNYYTKMNGVQMQGCASGTGGAIPLSTPIYIVNDASVATEQAVSVEKMLQGSAKTKIVNIQNATDSMRLNGQMLFAEGGSAPTGPQPLMKYTNNQYADAGNIAVAFIYKATNIDVESSDHAYAESIGFNIDNSGAKWNMSLKGDPTSLFPDFVNDSMIPYGYDGPVEQRVPYPLTTALRVGAWYDFYVEATVGCWSGGSSGTVEETDVTAYISKYTMNIAIGSEQINLLGRGQAPYFGINSMAMNGSLEVVFSLMDPMVTPVPTWQAVPGPWGTYKGMRNAYNDPVPNTNRNDWPDVLTVDSISIVPKYVYGQEAIIENTTFGPGFEPTDTKIIMKKSSIDINTGIIKASMDYEVIFSDTA